MHFILTKMTHEMGFRVFAFERTNEDRKRTGAFTVRADLALTRRYGIHLQDLPLICRGILERMSEAEEKRAFTFAEEEMCNYAKECAMARELAAQKRKPVHRPATENTGAAWRGLKA